MFGVHWRSKENIKAFDKDYCGEVVVSTTDGVILVVPIT